MRQRLITGTKYALAAVAGYRLLRGVIRTIQLTDSPGIWYGQDPQ